MTGKPKRTAKPKSVKGKGKGKPAKAKARPKPPASDLDESNDIHAATAASDAASTEAENAEQASAAPEQASAAPGRGRVLTATLSNASARSSTPMAEGGLRECKTHFDIQNWPAHVAQVVAQMTTPDMGGLETNAAITLEYAGENTTWSGCFSGVETYAIADMRMDLAYKKLNEKSRRRNTHVSTIHTHRHLWCVEWNAAARGELLIHPALGDCCIFGDVLSFVKPEFNAIIRHIQQHLHLHQVLKDVAISGRLVGTRPKAYCFRHNRVCEAQKTDGHRAGTPCTDFSKQ